MTVEYTNLILDQTDDVAWVTIDRVADRNSINTELMQELTALLTHLEQGRVRAVVFSGRGATHFIGGADGVEMMRLDPDGAYGFSRRIQELFARMESSPLILIAAIQGLCFGGGFEFAMACDFRLATEDSRIGLPEVKVGLIPGGGGTQRLTRLVGEGTATEMILGGQLCSGRRAWELGLVQHVLPEEGLEQGVHKVLNRILKQPEHVLPLAKKAIQAGFHGDPPDGFKEESTRFSRCFEHGYFRSLMEKQLQSGQLSTSTRAQNRG